ncbi:MAG: hypothetical protein LH647_03235 [Leptolyngbyaceae cyanobacterium CAN_BIN12]|nr:hypothetical protein [Leptolyngbyaceae cyanobacterium CAN_BIN12]
MVAQALLIAKSIKDESAQVDALSGIAVVAITLTDQEQAKTILSQSTQIVETSQDSKVISSFAQAYAELGNWGEALRLAQRCSGDDKVAVLARILRVHAEQQNPEFKALREKKADEE